MILMTAKYTGYQSLKDRRTKILKWLNQIFARRDSVYDGAISYMSLLTHEIVTVALWQRKSYQNDESWTYM